MFLIVIFVRATEHIDSLIHAPNKNWARFLPTSPYLTTMIKKNAKKKNGGRFTVDLINTVPRVLPPRPIALSNSAKNRIKRQITAF